MKRIGLVLFLWVFFYGITFAGGGKESELSGNPLSDVRVRQAIAYAIDMEAITKGMMRDKAVIADSLMPNNAWKAKGLNPYTYNPEKARSLLKEVGWDSDYVLDVAYYYSDQLTVDLMVAIQSYLDDVGIKMKFRKLEGDLAPQLWAKPDDPVKGPSNVDWDLAYAAVAALSFHEFYNRFEGGASSNSQTPTDLILDKLIIATKSTSDLDKQKEAFIALQKYENDNLFAIPLYYQQLFVFESDRIDRKNIPYGNEQFSYDWRIIDWDIKPNEAGERILYSNNGPVEFFQNPFVNPGSDITLKLLFDRLIVVDENLNPKKGQLASSYSVSNDGLTIDFKMRDKITWHDGVPISPEDVKFTIEYMSKVPTLNGVAANTCKCIEGYQEYIDGNADSIEGIKINGNVVTIKFSKIDPNALLTFSQWPPLPKHLLKDSDPVNAQVSPYWQAPVGSGPYKIDEVNMNDFATFIPYKGYWDEGSGNIEKIMLTPGKKNVVVNAESGRIDYAYDKGVDNAFAIEKLSSMSVHPVDIRYTRFFYVNKFPKK